MTAQTPDGGGLTTCEISAIAMALWVGIETTDWDDGVHPIIGTVETLIALRLAGHAEEVRAAQAKGWDEGHRHACEYAEDLCRLIGDLDGNPYRAAGMGGEES